jgi:hypothetical protein
MYGWVLLAVISDEGCLDHSQRRRAGIRQYAGPYERRVNTIGAPLWICDTTRGSAKASLFGARVRSSLFLDVRSRTRARHE